MPNSQTSSQKINIPFIEKIKSIPEIFGVRVNEEPEYEVLGKDGDKDIRLYQPQILATTPIDNSSDEARGRAFQKLAGYIFGRNRNKQILAMTSPVFRNQEQHGWSMSFILPKVMRYEVVPLPLERDIDLVQTAPQLWAVLRFSGNPDPRMIAKKIRELQMWVSAQSGYQVVSQPRLAQYDPPFSIPFLKRNEIQIQVRAIH